MTHISTTPANASQGLAETTLRRFAVKFTSITVTKIVDPGANAEVDFTFTVNRTTKRYVNNDLPLGTTTLPANLTLRTDIPGAGTLSIDVSGLENDVTSGDDLLPAFSRVFTQADGFGVGEHTGGGSNAHLAYTMTFKITEEPIPPSPPGGGDGGDGKPDGPGAMNSRDGRDDAHATPPTRPEVALRDQPVVADQTRIAGRWKLARR